MSTLRITHSEWLEEARKRYGERGREVRFRCPSCGHEQCGEDFLALGMEVEDIASRCGFSCIGRWMESRPSEAFSDSPGPCNYAGGGLICISPIIVEMPSGSTISAFDFADDPLAPTSEPAP